MGLIGDLSRRTGVNIETIRYYERVGVLPPPPRTDGGHRVYGIEHIKQLNFVRRCRELGFQLASIKEMLGMVDGGNVTCEQVKAISKNHLEDVRSKIADLKKMERTLSRTVSQCAGGQGSDCPIIDSLSSGKEGS